MSEIVDQSTTPSVTPPANVDTTEIYFSTVYGKLLSLIEEKGNMSPLTLPLLCLNMMVFLESFNQLQGQDKLGLMMKVFSKYFASESSSGMSESDKNLIMSMLPSLISTNIMLDRGELRIHLPVGCCGAKKRKNKKT
jgi:hypothetical protein